MLSTHTRPTPGSAQHVVHGMGLRMEHIAYKVGYVCELCGRVHSGFHRPDPDGAAWRGGAGAGGG